MCCHSPGQGRAQHQCSAQDRIEASRALLQQEQQSIVEILAVADQASADLAAERSASRRQKAEVQAEVDTLTAQLLAEQQQHSTELVGRVEVANADAVARQRQTTQFQALVVSLKPQLKAEQQQRTDVQSQMESQVQQLQAQLKTVRSESQLADTAPIETAKVCTDFFAWSLCI